MLSPSMRLCRHFALAALITVLLGPAGSAVAAPPVASQLQQDAGASLSPDLSAMLLHAAPTDRIPILVTLVAQSRLEASLRDNRAQQIRSVVLALQATATATQHDLLRWLEIEQTRGRVDEIRSFWIFNGLALSATPAVVRELAQRHEVAGIALDAADVVPIGAAPIGDLMPESPAPNVAVIGAPELWELGFRGQGVVVAIVDTGVDETHPDLADRWRGGGNSWYDPYNEHPADPIDLVGHGTWVTGIVVGGDASGTTLGVAPAAQWIATRIFDNRGRVTVSAIHAAFQWLLDPDGDPSTPDAPHAVVNAWSFAHSGCDLAFEPDLKALRAAGILPIFAAGNYGPNEETSVSPANNPGAFAVGATDNDDMIYPESSRGPTACVEDAGVYPEIVAPGVGITTTERYEGYISESGTSFAAPHVTGALALLLSAYPDLTPEDQEALLLQTARDLGVPGPDDTFGYGRLDVLAAYQAHTPPVVYRLLIPLVLAQPRATYRVYLPIVSTGRLP